MFKDLLLQFLVSILPVCAYQLWQEMDRGKKDSSIMMSISCGGSMILCMLTTQNIQGFEVDFRLIPYTIGILYGGIPSLAALTAVYVAMRLPMMDNLTETVFFGVFIVVYIFVMLLVVKPFQRSSAMRKRRFALVLMSFISVYFASSIIIIFTSRQISVNPGIVISIALYVAATLAATMLSVHMIESVREKRLLHNEVIRVSDNYRNEVEKLQQFIDETDFAVLAVDREGRITHVNELAVMLLGLVPEFGSAKSLLGQLYQHVFVPGKGDTNIPLLLKALNGTKETPLPIVEGDKVLLKTAFTLRNSVGNNIAGAALIAHDVTEVSRLRDEVGRMERLSLVGQMAASITHEIRNPMAVIRGFVQLIQERSPSSQRDYFRIIMEELDRANTIISDFLSLAQNRALEMNVSSLNDIIGEMLPLLEADANMRGQTLLAELGVDVPPLMLNDREIKQLLLNLARNGMEAMNDKGVLTLSTRKNGNTIELRIADNGIGIPQEQMKQLFEPFYTTKTRGTGLGLPLCLSIAERHNGRIEVESKEGEGTTFIVTFNVA